MDCWWGCHLRFNQHQVAAHRGLRVRLAVLLWLFVGALPARAEVYATKEQALKIVFAKATDIHEEVKSLTAEQRDRLQKESRLRFPEPVYTFSVAQGKDGRLGYALVMNEIGKSEHITFLVGVSPKGEVTDVVVMEFRESRGWEVKEKRFTSQFKGKKRKDPVRVNQDIMNYTGATLSSEALARGVKKALLLTDLFYGHAQ